MTKVFVKTWCADDHAWKVRTCHTAMTPTLTREIGVEDAVRQAYYSHRDMVFPTIENDDNRYFPRRRAEASGCRIAKIEEGESARLVETVPLVVALNSALDRSQLDQRDLWLEIEQLRAKVDAYERQQEQGGPLPDPLPPTLVVDHAIVTSRKRHHPGCTCTCTIIDP
jgi:hypothetical protein